MPIVANSFPSGLKARDRGTVFFCERNDSVSTAALAATNPAPHLGKLIEVRIGLELELHVRRKIVLGGRPILDHARVIDGHGGVVVPVELDQPDRSRMDGQSVQGDGLAVVLDLGIRGVDVNVVAFPVSTAEISLASRFRALQSPYQATMKRPIELSKSHSQTDGTKESCSMLIISAIRRST